MPLKTVTTAATRVQLSTTHKKVARLSILWAPTNTSTTVIYGGYAGETGNTGALVSSSAYDFALSSGQSFTLGAGSTLPDSIDLFDVWLDSSASGEKVAYCAEVI